MSVLNVFQPGLKRGSEHLPFDPEKAYAYVEHPTEGWRVYLRTATFLHPSNKPFKPQEFLVVKRTGARPSSRTWEPPKGQMEGKDMRRNPGMSVVDLLAENARREVEEESHVSEIQHLTHTGLVFQGQETNYKGKPWYFQYHIFEGQVSQEQIDKSFGTFAWFKEHPKAFARVSRDRAEKDAVAWFSPTKTPINPRWCPSIVALYLSNKK
uniref:Nudix hydrolase domain-containing protein n=1 Tax=viral metagenome TaxID=1070528 RepID=A0A6C0APQ8_9ZZZZ